MTSNEPTDLELMMFADGELEAERHAEVAVYLATSREATNKVKALGLGGEMVAHLAVRGSAADTIAASVMGAIAKGEGRRGAAENAAPTDLELMMYADGEIEAERRSAVEAHLAVSRDSTNKIEALRIGGAMVARQALRSGAKADGIADRVMAVIASEAAVKDEKPAASNARVIAAKKPAANDNARRIYATAAFAVAAAAALLVWGRGSEPAPFATPAPIVEVAPAATVASAPPPSAAPSAAPSGEEDVADPEPIHGVEVAAVEFGGKMGSIFYVPTGDSGGTNTTTVVWLADEAGEE